MGRDRKCGELVLGAQPRGAQVTGTGVPGRGRAGPGPPRPPPPQKGTVLRAAPQTRTGPRMLSVQGGTLRGAEGRATDQPRVLPLHARRGPDRAAQKAGVAHPGPQEQQRKAEVSRSPVPSKGV